MESFESFAEEMSIYLWRGSDGRTVTSVLCATYLCVIYQ